MRDVEGYKVLAVKILQKKKIIAETVSLKLCRYVK